MSGLSRERAMSVSSLRRIESEAPPQFRAPVGDDSAWLGADLAKNPERWIYRFSDQEVAEIETAVSGVLARGLPIEDIGRADFPLPTLGPRLDRFRREVVHGRGFILL